MTKCQFCENYDFLRDIEKEYDFIKRSYSAAIVCHSWIKERGKRNASRTVIYRKYGVGFKLNYCPECGRKL